MKTCLALFLIMLLSPAFSQKDYKAFRCIDRHPDDCYYTDFVILKDSTCYLKERYRGNAMYKLYKGRIAKVNDTLYELHYKPLVEFSCNKKTSTDSVYFELTQKDTVLPDLLFRIKPENGAYQTFKSGKEGKTVCVKGAANADIIVDTRFTDPLSHQAVMMQLDPSSSPYLVYYGTGTQASILKIRMVKNKLTIYPDKKHVYDKIVLTLPKP